MKHSDRSANAVQPYPRPSIEGGSAPLERKPTPPPKLSRKEIEQIRSSLRKKMLDKKRERAD